MRPTYFGTFDFTALGVKGREFQDDSRRRKSNLIDVPFASGAYDGFGSSASPKAAGAFSVVFVLSAAGGTTIDAKLDSFMQVVELGQQWFKAVHHDATTRRALAKCIGVSAPLLADNPNHLPVTATFELAEPFWYSDSQTTQTTAVSATPTAIDLTNSGTAPLVKMVLRFVGTAKSPKFLNNTNGYYIQHTGDIASQTWEVDTGAMTVKLDSANDWANVVMGPTQIPLFRYEVGSNDVDFVAAGGGTPSGTVSVIYRLTYQ